MDINGLERLLVHLLHTREDHTSNPEEDDVITGDQNRSRIEVIQLAGLFRPAEGRERPQCRGEPGIQNVLFLMDVRTAALRANGDVFLGNGHLAAVLTVVSRNTVTPPQLTGNAPVVNIFHPTQVGVCKTTGNKLDAAVMNNVHSGLCQRSHLNEPLCRGHRLDGGAAAIAGANVVLVVLGLDEVAALFQIAQNSLAAFVTIQTLILAAVFVDRCVLVEDQNLLEVVTLTHLEVVRVMARRGLNAAGTEFHIDIIVGEDRNFAIHDRQDTGLANQMLVTLVVGVDCNTGIAHEGLRTGGCNNEVLVGILDRILDVPQLAGLGFVLNLSVRQCGCTVRAPVDDTAALVDQTLFVQVYKDFLNSLRATLVHGEALTAPVTRRTELLELGNDAVAILVLPVPNALEELFTTQIITGLALIDTQVFFNLDLGCDTCMVGAGHPECGIALHALGTDQDILKGLIECMTHVQLTGNVRGRDDDGKGLLVLVYLCVEESGIVPELIQFIFYGRGIVCLGKFVRHLDLSFYGIKI